MTGTASQILEDMAQLATKLEREGNTLAAYAVRKSIQEIQAPRPIAEQYCDTCRILVTSPEQLTKYGDLLGVDWVLCKPCERRYTA